MSFVIAAQSSADAGGVGKQVDGVVADTEEAAALVGFCNAIRCCDEPALRTALTKLLIESFSTHDETLTTRVSMARFCSAAQCLLVLDGRDQGASSSPIDVEEEDEEDPSDGLRAKERFYRRHHVAPPPRPSIIKDPSDDRVAAEYDARLLRAQTDHAEELEELHAKYRESTRLAVYNAAQQTKNAEILRSSAELSKLRYELVVVKNKLRQRGAEVDSAAEKIRGLRAEIDLRDAELEDLRLALIKASVDSAHSTEDQLRTQLAGSIATDASISLLQNQVSSLSEKVLEYTEALLKLRDKQKIALDRQRCIHDEHVRVLEEEMQSLRTALAERNDRVVELKNENVRLSSRLSLRAVANARANAIAANRTPRFVPVQSSSSPPTAASATPATAFEASAEGLGPDYSPMLPQSKSMLAPRRPDYMGSSPSLATVLNRRPSFAFTSPGVPLPASAARRSIQSSPIL